MMARRICSSRDLVWSNPICWLALSTKAVAVNARLLNSRITSSSSTRVKPAWHSYLCIIAPGTARCRHYLPWAGMDQQYWAPTLAHLARRLRHVPSRFPGYHFEDREADSDCPRDRTSQSRLPCVPTADMAHSSRVWYPGCKAFCIRCHSHNQEGLRELQN